MFEKQRKLLDDKEMYLIPRERKIFEDILDTVKKADPEQAQRFAMSDLIPAPFGEDDQAGHQAFISGQKLLNFLASSSEAILDAHLYALDGYGERMILNPVEQKRALNRGPGRHPITGEHVNDMATISHVGYALMPEYVIEHMKHHDPDLGLIIAESAEQAQDYAVMGVPTLIVKPSEKQREFAIAKMLGSITAEKPVIAVKGALPDDFFMPRPYTIAPLPGSDPELAEYVRELEEKVTPWRGVDLTDNGPE